MLDNQASFDTRFTTEKSVLIVFGFINKMMQSPLVIPHEKDKSFQGKTFTKMV